MTLSILIWLPLVISLLATLAPRPVVGRAVALGSLLPLAVAISFIARFHPSHSGLQFVTDKTWIAALGIHYKLGLDGLNVVLVLLTTVLFSGAFVWASFREWDRAKQLYFQFGLAESAVLGAFCSQDLALFVAFFDLMLIPFYFLSGIWGTGDKVRATTKLVIYTLIGSFFMLAGAIATGVLASSRHHAGLTFVISTLQHLPLSHSSQEWIFLCFAIAFMVKMPIVPFHGWLADGYKAMPIPAVAVFSGILSKVAAYGFLRIVLPLFPYASRHFQTPMLIIALVSILWATSLAFTTPDARLVVAYSSVAQMSFITLGIFSLRPEGGQGAILQMVNHGARHGPAVLHRRRARCPRRRLGEAPRHGRDRVPGAGAGDAVPDRRVRHPGDARLLELRRRVPDPAWACSRPSSRSRSSPSSASSARPCTRCGCSSARCTTGSGPQVDSREIGFSDAAALVPIVVAILVLAFYPQFVLRRSENSVKASVAAANPTAPLVASR